MSVIAVRVRVCHDSDREKVVSWIKDNKSVSSYFLVLEHQDTNAHIQGFMVCDKDLKAMRNSFVYSMKEVIAAYADGKTGNGFYSMKAVGDTEDDKNRYLQYLCKGDDVDTLPVVLAMHGILYTDAWIKERHAAYWEENKALKPKRKKGEEPPHEKAWKRCVKAKFHGNERKAIAEVLIKEYRDADKPFNLHQIRAYVNLFSVKLSPGCVDEMADIVSRMV